MHQRKNGVTAQVYIAVAMNATDGRTAVLSSWIMGRVIYRNMSHRMTMYSNLSVAGISTSELIVSILLYFFNTKYLGKTGENKRKITPLENK